MKRINNHKECGENCAKFVKINGGVNKVLSPLTPSDNNLSNWEKDETVARMIKHGYNNVRCWEFTNTNKLTKEELDTIKISIVGLGDRCRKCGNNGHFASKCISEKAKWLLKLEKSYPNNTSCCVMDNLLDSSYKSFSDGWVCEFGCGYENKSRALVQKHEGFCKHNQKVAKKNKVCNRCGRKGHTVSHCYAETDVNGYELSDDESEQEDCCFRCGRPGHYANNCYAKKNVDGYYISD